MNVQELYEDPALEGALGGVEPFAKAHGLSRKQAEKELQSVFSYTLHKPRRKRFPTLPTMVYGRDEQWQLDLVDMQKLSKWNKGMKYLLTVIDVFSKAAWAEPIKNKGAKEMVSALERIKKRLHPRRPLRVQTDKGSEFDNAAVQAWFKKEGWDHFSTEGDSKASVVERWHRTLKQRMYRYFTAQNTLKYLGALPQLINTYNTTYHRSIGMKPLEVKPSNELKVWKRLYKTTRQRVKPPKLRKGDKVRLNKKHRPFKKEYLPGWTEEVFLVTKVRRLPIPSYKVSEWDGTPIKGTFYEQDLQKVQADDNSLFRVEKILKRKKGQVLVRWKGWPSKYDSWIPADNGKKKNKTA